MYIDADPQYIPKMGKSHKTILVANPLRVDVDVAYFNQKYFACMDFVR